MELTIPFEMGFKVAHQRKESKYLDLLHEAEKVGYTSCLITMETGSHSLPHIQGFKKLQHHLQIPNKKIHSMLETASRAAIMGLHKIWCTWIKLFSEHFQHLIIKFSLTYYLVIPFIYINTFVVGTKLVLYSSSVENFGNVILAHPSLIVYRTCNHIYAAKQWSIFPRERERVREWERERERERERESITKDRYTTPFPQ